MSLTLDRTPAPTGSPPPTSHETQQAPLTLSSRKGASLLASLTGAHFTHHISNSLLNPLLPFIRDSLALSYAQSGWLVSAFALSLGLSNAPVGVIADRFGPRPVIVVGLILTGLISAVLAFSQSYWQLFLALVVMGIIAGSYHAPASTLIARSFSPSVRGTAIGFHIVGGHLSFFLVPATAAYLVIMTDTWRTPYLWLAFAPVVMGLVVWRLAPARQEGGRGGHQVMQIFRQLLGVARLVGPLVSLSIVFQMSYAALNAFLALYLVDARGLSREMAAVVFGLPQLVGVLGTPFAGNLSDRVGRRAVIIMGMAGFGPAFLLLTLVPEQLIVLPLLAIGAAAALRQTATEVLVLDSAPPERRATVLGSYYMLSQELGGLAAPALGLLASLVGVGQAFSGVCVVLAILSMAVLLGKRRL